METGFRGKGIEYIGQRGHLLQWNVEWKGFSSEEIQCKGQGINISGQEIRFCSQAMVERGNFITGKCSDTVRKWDHYMIRVKGSVQSSKPMKQEIYFYSQGKLSEIQKKFWSKYFFWFSDRV